MHVYRPHDRLGGYSILRHVRLGSTGQLYVARRVAAHGFAPNVALKIIHPSLLQTKAASDLLDEEIIRVAKIDDPRVLRLDELGDDHGVRYVAMELARGFSLSDMLAFYYDRERRIRPGLAVYIAMQGALALQAAHETRDPQGNHLRIVHGSLTTKRVLVSWKGHVKLARFGFAKVMADEPLTSWQRLFRAPEQARARGERDAQAQDGDKIDARVDIYALAAVLLASLARGGLPVLESVVDLAAIPGALARAEGIPEAVGAVLIHALQPRREDRMTPLAFYRALVDTMPEATKITPSDVARELAAIRLDREFSTFAQDRSLVGSSYIPPRMTEVPSPFSTTHPRASNESNAASERLVVPRMPKLPKLGSLADRIAAVVPEVHPDAVTPRAPEVETPPPPKSSASMLTAARVEYPAAAEAGSAAMAPTGPPASYDAGRDDARRDESGKK